jgi:hypothetical protein
MAASTAQATKTHNATTTKPQAEKIKKEKQPKPELPKHPSIGSKDPNVYPLKATPADWTHDKFAKLDKDDFEKRSAYLEYRATEFDRKAKELRDLAKTADEKGGKSKLDRYAKMVTKADELRAQLEAAGIDVNALLAATKAKQAQATSSTAPAKTGV